MELKGKKINFLGDSITEGVGASSPETCFVEVVKRKADLKEARNYGIGGTRFAVQPPFAVDFPPLEDFCTRALRMDEDADAVVVFGGTNDFGHGCAPIGSFDDETPDTFYGACHTLFRTLLTRYTDKPILVLTPMHRLNEDNPRGDCVRANATFPLSGYVDIIKEVAAYYALPVLDLFSTSGIQPKFAPVREKLCPDGLHPSDKGHEIIADRIIHALEML